MLAVCNNQKEIADISLKLGDLLRKTIEFPGHIIKLEEEISIVRDYLEIQKYRFDRIDYKIELHEDPSKIYTIPFLIQPLVENSIIHGLEKQIERGFIHILVDKENSNLIISVIDNGIGMNKSTKELIFEKNTALMNIKERIKLHYGEEYGINVESEEGRGTKVQIILPYDKVIRGDKNV